MQDSVLQWGFISTARINQALIPPLRASRRNHLLGIASRNLATARAYARDTRIPRAFGSYEEMLADPGIDVVYVSLPNGLHAEWTLKALQAGKHVLCEKPLTTTLADVDALIAACSQTGRVVAEAFMYRHHPQTLRVKKLVEDGALGKLQLMRGWFTIGVSRQEDIRWDPALGGGGIWDVGCYPISYARLLAGAKPIQVFGWQVASASGVDENFAGQLRFPGDMVAQTHSSMRSQYNVGFEIIGSEASLWIPQPFSPREKSQIFLRRNRKEEKISFPKQDLYLGEVEDLAEAVFTGKPPRVSLQESRDNIETILALLKSASQGAPVNV